MTSPPAIRLPATGTATIRLPDGAAGAREVRLTNLDKPFWPELESGVDTRDFHLGNVPARVDRLGDLWQGLADRRAAISFEPFLKALEAEA